ncbi:uncharacterized protein BDV17DRAFT_182617 [Aspergillus undulatus]|uniref:uncharacterized protein n=1 Tax=Aspergillus undulatus TaxID=1810928 RepID=UPI003CCD9082
MADRPRIVLEKSRTVRRRYQRSNKRFQFTASQIARIEREEERERRAQKLRDKEKKRVQEKKKKAEKEAKAREERMRRGLPDPNAPTVPASQPLLFNFIKKTPSVQPESQGSETLPENETETGIDSVSETEVASESGDEELGLEDDDLDNMLIALGDADEKATAGVEHTEGPDETVKAEQEGKDEDEFSECSAFYDEDVIKETEAVLEQIAVATVVSTDSFHDDTAILLEEFAPEFDPGASFDEELAQLDAT